MRFIKGDEFAQGFHQNGERAGVAFTLRRYLADACEALFNLVHLPFGGTPEFGNQLPARFARVLAASARRTPRDWREPSRRIRRATVDPVIKHALADAALGANLRNGNAVGILLPDARDGLG